MTASPKEKGGGGQKCQRIKRQMDTHSEMAIGAKYWLQITTI